LAETFKVFSSITSPNDLFVVGANNVFVVLYENSSFRLDPAKTWLPFAILVSYWLKMKFPQTTSPNYF
jgi:hypothetical protein